MGYMGSYYRIPKAIFYLLRGGYMGNSGKSNGKNLENEMDVVIIDRMGI